MRYALRNQSKIKAGLGVDVLGQLLDSLKLHFKSYDTLQLDKSEPGQPYPIIEVVNSKDENEIFKFYVVGRTFDVRRLAYCETKKQD